MDDATKRDFARDFIKTQLEDFEFLSICENYELNDLFDEYEIDDDEREEIYEAIHTLVRDANVTVSWDNE